MVGPASGLGARQDGVDVILIRGGQHTLRCGGQIPGAGVAIVGVFGHAASNDLVELGRNLRTGWLGIGIGAFRCAYIRVG